MADPRPTALSLFSGIGGLDLGWECATGGRVVGYCERDAYAAVILLARMEDQALEPAPIWCGDICELDVTPFHGVDWVIGGFPCQDISVAGKGGGIEGKRSGLWSELLRAYRDTGARWLFVENVAAITVRGLDRVLCDLAEIGAHARWVCLRASDVGAPHRRNRFFLLADTCCERRQQIPAGALLDGKRPARGLEDGRCGETMGNPDVERLEIGEREPEDAGQEYAPTERAMSLFPPGPDDDWSPAPRYLHPAIEPGLCRMADGHAYVVDASRSDRLRCLGNGVVPLQAAAALRWLLNEW